MITAKNISKIYSSDTLFTDVSFTINDNDRVAIIGDNGVGKTTLMKILLNPETATDGQIMTDNKSIGYLSQKVIESEENTVIQEFNLLFKNLINIRLKMEELLQSDNFSTDQEIIKEYGNLENKYAMLGGYDSEFEIDKLLTAFRFTAADKSRKIKTFSGGQKTKLALIKLLLKKPSYLFLDEPTNHLDIETIEWLESYLRNYPGAVILISHDRYFIDRVCTKILEIEQERVNSYNTNYTNYLTEKELRYQFQLASYERQQNEIKKLNEFIERFRGKPSKIGQVNDRKSKLARIELIEKPLKVHEKVNFKIEGLNIKKAPYIDLLDVAVGYDQPLVSNIDMTIMGGDRIGVIGQNGTGKSTLVKTMLKQIPPLSGQVILHSKIKIGYFDQVQNNFDPETTIYDLTQPFMPEASKSYIRSYLARFLFKRDDVFKKVKSLSGGEKVRLVLSQFALKKYDLIILDEPTNHLDLNTKQVLEDAINNYEGTIICVSHDRYFINKIVNKYVLLQPNSFQTFSGRYDQYVDYLQTEKAEKKEKKIQGKKQKKIINKNVAKLEKAIEKEENKKSELIALSQQEEVYLDYERANEVNKELQAIEELLDELYTNYEQEIKE